MMISGIVPETNVEVEVRDAQTGEMRDRQGHHNLTVMAGRNLIRDLLNDGSVSGLSHFDVGTDGSSTTSDMTGLLSPSPGDRYAFTSVDDSQDAELKITYFLDAETANGLTLREAGLFNDISNGRMYARAVINEIEKDSTKTVTFNWTLRWRAD